MRRGLDCEHEALKSYIEKSYKTVEKIGQGTSGMVYQVKSKKTGEQFALKRIPKQKVGNRDTKDVALETEIACLRKLQHRHVVNIVEAVESPSTLWIIMEYAAGGGLYERILQVTHFSEKSAALVVKQVLKAVHYMHQCGVVHRDLKPENILLTTADQDSDVKVCDFGLAVDLGSSLRDSTRTKEMTMITEGYCGSPICMAPEVSRKDAAYGPQCDVWSIGCMSHELLSGEPPFMASNPQALFTKIQNMDGPAFGQKSWETASPEAKELVTKMLRKRPSDRFTASEALKSVWFARARDVHRNPVLAALQRTANISCATTARNSSDSEILEIQREVTRVTMRR